MKKTLLFTLICTMTATLAFGAQSIAFDDLGLGGGTATSGTYNSTDTFSLDVNVTFDFASKGLSFWLEAANALAPNLSITGITYGTVFPNANQAVPNPTAFNSASGNSVGFLTESPDLGSVIALGSPDVQPGTYKVAHITFALNGAAPGSYTLETTTLSPKVSEVTDSNFGDNALPAGQYSITIAGAIPEPSTFALLGLAGLGLGLAAARRRS